MRNNLGQTKVIAHASPSLSSLFCCTAKENEPMPTKQKTQRAPENGNAPAAPAAHETVFVDQFTDGILDPARPMLGPVRDGGHIVANTAPGCWGPMITPAIRGGHEVTRPVAVAGAEVGDAIVLRIKGITVTSLATASGNDRMMSGRFLGDPYVAGKCPECGMLYPPTVVKGIGQSAVRCANCGADASPFTFTNGYTIAFDGNRTVGVTLDKKAAEQIAHDAKRYAALPDGSDPAPDPDLRPPRSGRPGGTAAAVYGPTGHHAFHPLSGFPQRGRFRLLPHRRAPRIRVDRGATEASYRRPHGHRRSPRRRHPHLPGQSPRRGRLSG